VFWIDGGKSGVREIKDTFLDAGAEIGQLFEFGELRWVGGVRNCSKELFFESFCDGRVLKDVVCCYCQGRFYSFLACTDECDAFILEPIDRLLLRWKVRIQETFEHSWVRSIFVTLISVIHYILNLAPHFLSSHQHYAHMG